MPICPAVGCQRAILESEATLKVSPGQLKRGQKTGGLYHSASFEEDILIHYRCVHLFFNPQADATMYDEYYALLHDQVRDEELEDIKRQAYAEAAEDLTRLCPDCLTDREDPDKPPEEYSCSSCGSGALPVCPDCGDVSDLAVDLFDKQEAA